MSQPEIEARKRFSEEMLAKLRQGIAAISALKNCPNLCVYATGSFARRDAGKYSDLDIFFISTPGPPVPRIDQMLIYADLIQLCRSMGMPEFSGDGQYLRVHTLRSIVDEVGSQKEDYENFFTTRLLLLLESAALYNQEIYDEVVGECVRAYYRDYHDHTENFRPVFLVNDISRFWKTLCLNYEHKRNRRDNDRAKEEGAKRKSHLKNFKLKFSRLLTCFSMVACLCDAEGADHPDKAILLVKQAPIDRLDVLTQKHGLEDLWNEMKGLYDWFLLETTSRPTEVAEAWIAQKEIRREVFQKAETFGDMMHDLLGQVAHKSGRSLRYLVV
jgi:predicted nucleotidyltransferase